jgi:hypothetical protein
VDITERDFMATQAGALTNAVVRNIGTTLAAEFEANARKRQSLEDRWAKDLRQYLGVYDPEVLANLDENRSKVFLRLTKIKCDTMVARLIDLLFPASNEKNWNLEPSAEPSLHPDMVASVALDMRETVMAQYAITLEEATRAGKPAPPEPKVPDEKWIRDQMTKGAELHPALKEKVDDACKSMSRQIEDQLGGGVNRLSYREVSRAVMRQGMIYGTGVLKGPLVERRTLQKWQPNEAGKWEMATIQEREIKPFFEWVPVWRIFPDMEAKTKKEMRFIWQEYLLMQSDLLELAERPQFKAEVIEDYIRNHPHGDAAPRNYESTLHTLKEESAGNSPDYVDRYRVLERWGYLKGRDLAEAGVEIPENQMHRVFAANVWILGTEVIKAVLSPLKGVVWPYHFFYYSQDETSIFGEGIATVMRDPQSALNASVRLMLDNAALASGPIIGVLLKYLSGDQDPDKITPWTVLKFSKGEDIEKALKVFEMPAYTEMFLALCKFFFDFTDEVTTPRFISGSGSKVQGAGETASGLSMLMGSANINIKDLVKGWDDDITTPFLEALYNWNMQFSDDETVKGDFDVIATGTRSLIQKEILAEKLIKIAQLTADPRYRGRVKDDKFLAELFKSMDMDSSLLRDDDEFEAWNQQQMLAQATADARGKIEAAVAAAQARGLDPTALLAKHLAEAQATIPGAATGPQEALAA